MILQRLFAKKDNDEKYLDHYSSKRGIGRAIIAPAAINTVASAAGAPVLGHTGSMLVGRWRGLRAGEKANREGKSDKEVLRIGSRHAAAVGGTMAAASAAASIGSAKVSLDYVKNHPEMFDKSLVSAVKKIKISKGKAAIATAIGAGTAAIGSSLGAKKALKEKMRKRNEVLVNKV